MNGKGELGLRSGETKPACIGLQAIVVIALVLCGMRGSSYGDEQGITSVSIKGQRYSYYYYVYSPPKEIDVRAARGTKTPLDAITTFYHHMKSGSIASWRKLWAEGALRNFTSSDEVLLDAWKASMSEPDYLSSLVVYGEWTILTTNKVPDSNPRMPRRVHFLKQINGGYFFVQGQSGDAFVKMMLLEKVDPVRGRIPGEPAARYEFESARSIVELDDTSRAILSNTDHSINNAKGYNVRLGDGSKGRGLVFDGDAYVELPSSTTLSFYLNQVFMQLAINVKEIPEDEGHRDEQGRYKSVLLEKGLKGLPGLFRLEAMQGDGSKEKVTLRFSVGDGDDQEYRQVNVTKGAWHDIGLACSKEGIEMTVDGKVASAGSGPGKRQKEIRQPFGVFYLGKSTAAKPFFFSGSMDELSISNESRD